MKKAFFALSCIYIFTIFSEERTLLVGTASGYAPFVSLNAEGQYEGFDIDVANLLSQKLNKSLKIIDLGTLPSLFLALEQGKIDVVIWAISITEQRSKKMQMIYYQGEKELTIPFLFWEKLPEDISCLDDLCKDPKKKICVEAGSWQESVIEDLPNVIRLDCLTSALLELQYGKSYAVAVDPSLASSLLEKNPKLKALALPLPLHKQSLGNGICIAKKNTYLASKVQEVVTCLIKEGKILELEKKWGLKKTNE